MKKGTTAVLSTIIGAIIGGISTGSIMKRSLIQKGDKVDKFKAYYNILNEWLILRQDGKTLEKFFTDNGYKEIAIYGMGEMGSRLYEELKNSSVKVKYAIDKEAGSIYAELDTINLDDELPEVDAVIVTAVFAFNDIEEKLSEKFNCPIISLEDVVFER